jgi:DNA-binding transcriptional LysR family regulator
MDLHHLTHFVAVAEEQNFTRAAARLHIVQSGLSASIQALERDLGATLFRRTTQRVELTEEGRALLGHARRTLAAATAAREAVAAVQGLTAGRLTVGVMQIAQAYRLPDLLAQFHRAHPGIELRLRQASSADLLELVRSGDVDLAFLTTPQAPAPGVELTELLTDPMPLACYPGHRLAGRARVTPRDLEGESFVDFMPGWGTRAALDRVLAAAGVHRVTAFEVNDIALFVALVERGLGIGFVPQAVATINPQLRYVPSRPSPTWRVSLAYPAGGPVSAAGRAMLGEVLAEWGRAPTT